MLPTLRQRAFAVAISLTIALTGCSAGGGSPSGGTPIVPIVPATAKAKFVYTGNQVASLSGYSVNTTTGQLTALPGFPLPLGANPTAIAHDPQNRFLFVADISSGLFYVFAIDSTSGALSQVSPSPYQVSWNPPYSPEPVSIAIDPAGTHVYIANMGNDYIDAYSLNSTGVLTPVVGSPFLTGNPGPSYTIGNGMFVNAAGTFLYLQDIKNLYTFAVDSSSGALKLQQTIAGPSFGFGLAADPSGAYLYAVGSGTSSILAYSIDSSTGLLTQSKSSPMLEQNGSYTITVAPSGNSAYTIEDNNLLVSYSLHNGVFTPIGTAYNSVYGMQIAVDPSSSFLYVPQACANCNGGAYNVINEFAIAGNGALTRMPTGTIPAGVTPWGITITTQE